MLGKLKGKLKHFHGKLPNFSVLHITMTSVKFEETAVRVKFL